MYSHVVNRLFHVWSLVFIGAPVGRGHILPGFHRIHTHVYNFTFIYFYVILYVLYRYPLMHYISFIYIFFFKYIIYHISYITYHILHISYITYRIFCKSYIISNYHFAGGILNTFFHTLSKHFPQMKAPTA